MNKNYLQVGLGSMGKRRIRNLLANDVKKENIFGFDLSGEKREEAGKEYGIVTFENFKDAVEKIRPDVYLISTPPDRHREYFLHAAREKKHFFVEVTTHDAGYDELTPLLDGSFVAAPSCTYRFFRKDPFLSVPFGTVSARLAPMGRLPPGLLCPKRNRRLPGDVAV
jgi:hypothetical protein